jgi:hypothetical protein
MMLSLPALKKKAGSKKEQKFFGSFFQKRTAFFAFAFPYRKR